MRHLDLYLESGSAVDGVQELASRAAQRAGVSLSIACHRDGETYASLVARALPLICLDGRVVAEGRMLPEEELVRLLVQAG